MPCSSISSSSTTSSMGTGSGMGQIVALKATRWYSPSTPLRRLPCGDPDEPAILDRRRPLHRPVRRRPADLRPAPGGRRHVWTVHRGPEEDVDPLEPPD